MMMKLILTKVELLDDDYNEVLITKDTKSKFIYREAPMIERVIDKKRYNDIYVLIPNRIYKVHIDNNFPFSSEFVHHTVLTNELISSGVLFLGAEQEYIIYIKNCSDNPVYIQKGSPVGYYIL